MTFYISTWPSLRLFAALRREPVAKCSGHGCRCTLLLRAHRATCGSAEPFTLWCTAEACTVRHRPEHACNSASEPHHGSRVQLRDPRFVNAEPNANLFHGQSFFVIKIDNRPFAFRQAHERRGKKVSLFAAVTLLKRIITLNGREVFLVDPLVVLVRNPRGCAFKSNPLQFGNTGMPLPQSQPQRHSHFRVFRWTAEPAFKVLAGGLNLLHPPSHVAGRMVLAPQRIKDGSSNPMASVTLNGHPFGRVKLSDRVNQTYGPVTDQIIQFHVRGKVYPQPDSNSLHQRQQLHHHVVAAAPIMRRVSALRCVLPSC